MYNNSRIMCDGSIYDYAVYACFANEHTISNDPELSINQRLFAMNAMMKTRIRLIIRPQIAMHF